MPFTHEYIYFKFLQTEFHILHWIRNSYGIQIPPIGRSYRHCPYCLQTRGVCVCVWGGGVNIGGRREEEEVGYSRE